MQTQPIISLVIPVYKVEPYIERCLDSCTGCQSLSTDEYEIICVNDGSPDNSVDVIKQFVKDNNIGNIKIVNRLNGGLSAARNTGLEYASARYVWFIDSDDYIAPEALTVLVQAINSSDDADIINFNHRRVDNDGPFYNGSIERECENLIICTGIGYLESHKFMSACSRIYNRYFLNVNSLRFLEGIIWEDSQFNIRALAIAGRVISIDNTLYNYVMNPSTITTGSNVEKTLMSRKRIVDSLIEWMNNRWIASEDKRVICRHLTEQVIFYLAAIPQLPSSRRQEYRDLYKSMLPHVKFLGRHSDIKGKVISAALTYCPQILGWIAYRKMHSLLKR